MGEILISHMSRLQYGGDEERRERESTFSRLLRNARLPDTWHLDLDDIFYEYMSSSTAALIFFLITLLIMIFLRNKFDVVFWTVLVITERTRRLSGQYVNLETLLHVP